MKTEVEDGAGLVQEGLIDLIVLLSNGVLEFVVNGTELLFANGGNNLLFLSPPPFKPTRCECKDGFFFAESCCKLTRR